MSTPQLYRYRIAVVRRGADAQPADAALREQVYLHAPNAIAAQLLARAVTGAETALEPERLGEVELPLPAAAPSECGGFVVFA
jgi:hypothetical protein